MSFVQPTFDGAALPPDSIAFVCGDSKQLGSLTRLLKRAVGQVAVTDTLQGISDLDSYALVAVHYDALSAREQSELAKGFGDKTRRPTLLLLSDKCAQRDFATLFASHTLTNMLVVNESGPDISDLLVTVQKIRQNEIFGLEKYFVWGVEPRTARMRSSLDKNPVLDEITEYAAGIGVPARLRASIRTVADEFITNAVYNAPVTADGTPRYSSQPRTIPVYLEPSEVVEVRYCCDGRRFGLSTVDPFGSLTPARLQDYLARAFRGGDDQVSDSDGGAGLGFYQILDGLSHFVVNIDPGKKTEMIGLIDVSGGYRAFANSGKSFNIFVRDDAR